MLVGVRTDKGVIRDKNEDSFYISDDHRFFIIADGVGGCNSGEVASRVAVEGIAAYLKERPFTVFHQDEEIYHYLSACLKSVNKQVISLSKSDIQYNGMGTTIVLLYIVQNKMYVAYMGDSRGYLIRNREIVQITQDHTISAELLRSGTITDMEAKTHPQRNVITRALGIDENIEAEMSQMDLEKDDIVILCTDGLYNEVEEKEILDTFLNEENIQKSCDSIVELVNRRESRDNITILALKMEAID